MTRTLALMAVLLLLGLSLWVRRESDSPISPVATPERVSTVEETFRPVVVESAPIPTRAELVPEAAAEDAEDVPDPEGQLCLRVLVRETRLPCADAWVRSSGDTFACDAQGFVELRYPRTSRNGLLVGAPGCVDTSFWGQSGHETRASALVVELERAATLVAILEEAPSSGYPALRVTTAPETTREPGLGSIGIVGEAQVYRGHPELALGYFDREGQLELSGLQPNMPLELSVVDGRSTLLESPELVALVPGERRVVRLRLQDACDVSGVAHDERGSAVAGLALWLLRAPLPTQLFIEPGEKDMVVAGTRTDAQGNFVFRAVQPGTWRIGPAANERKSDSRIEPGELAPVATLVEITPGTHEQQVELQVRRGYAIAGTVLGLQGEPAPRVIVLARAGTTTARAFTRGDGSFELGPLPSGSYEVFALLPRTLVPSEVVHAEAGARDVVLRLRRSGTLTGRVVDASTGEGVAAQILVTRPAEPEDAGTRIFSESDGSFEVDGLAAGNYALVATPYDERVGILRGVELADGGQALGLKLTLVKGARVSVSYEGPGTAELRAEQAGVRTEMLMIEKSRPKEFAVPAGAVRIVLRTSAGRQEAREITLEAGELREVRFKAQD